MVVLLAVPWAHSIWRAHEQGYRVTGDLAGMSLRSHDVLSTHPPLLGQTSTSSIYSTKHRPVHPGPIEFYLLALPQRLLGETTGAVLGAAFFSLGSVLVAAWVIFRRAGPWVGVLGAVVLAGIAWSEGPAVLIDILSSNVGGIPLLALAALAWAVLDGDIRLLPLAAVLFAFVTQAHLAIFAIGVAMGLWTTVAVVRYVLRWRWRDRSGVVAAIGEPSAETGAPGVDAAGPPWSRWSSTARLADLLRVPGRPTESPRRWILGAAAVTVVAWLPVLGDAVAHRGGNLRLILGFGGEGSRKSLGLGSGLDQATRALGAPPLLMRHGLGGLGLSGDTSPVAAVTAIVVFGLLIAITVWGWRRRPAMATLALTTIVLTVAGAVNGAQVPASYEASRVNFYRWMFAVSTLAWLVLLWAAATVTLTVWAPARTLPRRPFAYLGLVAVAFVSISASVGRSPVNRTDAHLFALAGHTERAATAAVRGDGTLLYVHQGMGADLGPGPAVVLELERHGHHVLVSAHDGTEFGSHRVLHHGDRYDAAIEVISAPGRVKPGPGHQVFDGNMDPARHEATDALIAAAAGRPVVFSEDAPAILARHGITGRRAALMTTFLGFLRNKPRAVLTNKTALALIDEGILDQPSLDPTLIHKLQSMGDPVTYWGDDAYAIRVLTPSEVHERYPHLP